jgi:uncharacterized protein YndB with AHSA1/START domain
MTVISSSTDADDLTLTLVAEFGAEPERVWRTWEDPRVLERWWGPPGFPVTFSRYEFEPGGQCRYRMTGPEGFVHQGWWRIDALDRPRRIAFAVGPSGDDGEPIAEAGAMDGVVTFEPVDAGTRMTVVTRFADAAQMEQMVGGGMEEGMRQQLVQLAELVAG